MPKPRWTPARRATSAPKASACAAPSTCSSRPSRILAVREMILADKLDARKAALAKLLPMQRQDFIEIFEIMAGLPVTIRLLDPPLHEFLPQADHEIEEVAEQMNANPDIAAQPRVAELDEFNPMLGHRGVRLLITYPEIAEMQARAIFEAATEVARKSGKAPIPEVMVPLVATQGRAGHGVQGRIVTVAEARGARDRRRHRLSGRHHDRTAARGAAGRRDRRIRRVLLLRHQ